MADSILYRMVKELTENWVSVPRWDEYNTQQYEGRNRSLSNVTEQHRQGRESRDPNQAAAKH